MQYIDSAIKAKPTPATAIIATNDIARAAPITRKRISHWLTAGAAVAASDDKRFADDGETLILLPHKNSGLSPRPAAVLILFVNDNSGESPLIVFTQRTAHLTDHAGQISFPGGRVEPSDANVIATAVRETHEETGILLAEIDVIGTLPQYTTGTGYIITPVVAWADEALRYAPDTSEVEEVFEVPAQFLLAAQHYRREQAMYKGRMREYYAVPYMQRYIWGATAGMLLTLLRVMAEAEGLGDISISAAKPDSA
jgi:8-oxo-dGTP pyrophosphatase MutT (NUDIX family)